MTNASPKPDYDKLDTMLFAVERLGIGVKNMQITLHILQDQLEEILSGFHDREVFPIPADPYEPQEE